MKIEDNKSCEVGAAKANSNHRVWHSKKATTIKCPKCGAVMREKNGRYGRFLGCSNYPRCHGARDLKPTDNSMPAKPTRRRAGLRVIFPETINYGFQQRQPRPSELSIYRHDDADATAGPPLTCEALQDTTSVSLTLDDESINQEPRGALTCKVTDAEAGSGRYRISRLNEFIEFFESDQEWMTLEDYCLKQDLLLDRPQLIREGKAITRYLRTHSLPGPHKLPHDLYGTVNGYRRCSLDRWYEGFRARQ